MGLTFQEKTCQNQIFEYTSFKNTNLKNANLRHTIFVVADLTDANLAGADLSSASFAYSNLSGVNLDGTTLHATNFGFADLSGQDFTVTDAITDGLSFIETNLSNSNFEGVDLSPKQQYSTIFKNKAYLISGGTIESPEADFYMIKNDLFGGFTHVLLISVEVSGDDLAVTYIFSIISLVQIRKRQF